MLAYSYDSTITKTCSIILHVICSRANTVLLLICKNHAILLRFDTET